MKACPACGRLYPDDAGFCPVDGAQLTSATQVPVLADNQDARIGQLLCNRYQVRRVVADGGMGRVYEALDMQARRNVALKVLHPDVSRDQIAVQRFKREFEVSKMLPHDYIVEVLDFQPTPDESFVLAMEFLYGEELRATLKREQVILPARMLRMLSQVAIGLDQAHARKFVHRDLKPDNLFLCQTHDGDIAKLLDFGSAKDKGESAKKLTVLGTTIGSPFYMAPEQAQGLDTLDQRAAVWALAALVYECVVGRVPFIGNNGPSILLQILTKDPKPPSEAARGRNIRFRPRSIASWRTRSRRSPGSALPPWALWRTRGGRRLRSDRQTHSWEWAKASEGEIQSRAIKPRCPHCNARSQPPKASQRRRLLLRRVRQLGRDGRSRFAAPHVAAQRRRHHHPCHPPTARHRPMARRAADAYADQAPASDYIAGVPKQPATTCCCTSRSAAAHCSSGSLTG